MMRGRFVTFEGGEGTGKSTQARLLAGTLETRGVETRLTREPGGTAGAENIRDLLLDPEGDGWAMRAEALLFAAARADHVERAILPALDRGEWVVCDRFLDSSRAYQGGEGDLGDDDILALHRIGSRGLLPDLTILLDVDDESVARRLAARDGNESDRIGGRDAEYHAKVRERFSTFAQVEPGRFAVIAADGRAEDVHEAVLAEVEKRLGISR